MNYSLPNSRLKCNALSCLLSRIFEVNGNRGAVRCEGSGTAVPWWLLRGDSAGPSRTRLFRLGLVLSRGSRRSFLRELQSASVLRARGNEGAETREAAEGSLLG